MKVYVVFDQYEHNFGCTEEVVKKIFKSRDSAEKYCLELTAKNNGKCHKYDPTIEEWDVE